jgi:hypothetical protein
LAQSLTMLEKLGVPLAEAQLCALESCFESRKNCARCGRVFGEEVIYRRVFRFAGSDVIVGVVMCTACDEAVRADGPETLERAVLANMPVMGRA